MGWQNLVPIEYRPRQGRRLCRRHCRRRRPATTCTWPFARHTQVRSLTRDVGTLREALRGEEKKRERLAAHAKAGDDARQASEAKVKQLSYVNT